MKHFKPLSLSLQKEIAQRNICLESEIDKSMDSFGFRTMLHQCGIYKQKGYPTIITLYLMILLPFVKKCMTSLWTADSFRKMCDAYDVRFIIYIYLSTRPRLNRVHTRQCGRCFFPAPPACPPAVTPCRPITVTLS